jgi:hypothetical protein
VWPRQASTLRKVALECDGVMAADQVASILLVSRGASIAPASAPDAIGARARAASRVGYRGKEKE